MTTEPPAISSGPKTCIARLARYQAPDPQLHAHAVILNATYDESEKRRKAVQLGNIVRDKGYYQAAFHARLAGKLSDLGYGIEKHGNSFTLSGISRDTVEAFSRRSAVIDAEAARLGIDDQAAKGKLGRRTREKKAAMPATIAELREEWRKRATPEQLAEIESARNGWDRGDRLITPDQAKEYALAHSFQNASTISEKRLKAEALTYGVGSVLPQDVADIAQHPEVIGETRGGQLMTTTKSVLRDELSMLQFAKDGQRKQQPFLISTRVDTTKSGQHTDERAGIRIDHVLIHDLGRLSDEQKKAALHILNSRDTVTGVVGNLTQGGLAINREANVMLDSEDELLELRKLFSEFWDDAKVLTSEKLAAFTKAWSGKRGAQDPDPWVEAAVGISEPLNSSVTSQKRTTESIFMESLRRQLFEYGAAFGEVNSVLTAINADRKDLKGVAGPHRTNRFLNWVRITKAPGDDAWKDTKPRSADERKANISALGREWANLEFDGTQPTEEYLSWLERVGRTFASKERIADASKEDFTDGLMALHAFYDRLRFVEGGKKNLPTFFWSSNEDDVEKVRRSLSYLVFGSGDFPYRLNEFVSDPNIKISNFGKFCGLELVGTVRPDVCPPMNGRTAKAMRFLSYDVAGN